MIGEPCGVCGETLRESDYLRGNIQSVPHIGAPDSQIHAICPGQRRKEA